MPLSWNLGTLNSWKLLGHSRPVTGLLYLFINTFSHNLGTLSSWNPLDHSRPVTGLLYLFINTLSHKLGTLTSWNPLGHSRPVMGLLCLFINTLSHNLGTLTSWNPLGHSRPVMGLLYLYLMVQKKCSVIVKAMPFSTEIYIKVSYIAHDSSYCPLCLRCQWVYAVAYPGILFMGVQQIQLRTDDRENGDLGAVAPLVRGSTGNCNLVQKKFHFM